jgi:hypothetical protein
MLAQEILKHPTRGLTGDQRDRYFEDGCAVVEGVADASWLKRLRAAMEETVQARRQKPGEGARS